MVKSNQIIKIFLLLFVFTTPFLFQVKGETPLLDVEYLTNNNGLTNNTVYDICQDKEGFMWFSTSIGLNRYDGKNIKHYYSLPNGNKSESSTIVARLVYTNDGKLFAGTNEGVSLYNPENDNFEHILSKENTYISYISSLSAGYQNELLIGNGKDMAYIYNYETKSQLKFDVNVQIYGMTTDDNNTYWGFSRQTLFRFNRKGKQIAKYQVSPSQFESDISYIKFDENKQLWVGTFQHGLFVFNPKTNSFVQPEIFKKTKMHYVRTMEYGGKAGEYWVGTESGLYIIDIIKNKCTHYTQSFDNKHQTINDNAIYKIFQNKQKTFFIGTFFGGVNIINNKHIGFSPIRPENKPYHLQGKAINMFAKASDGKLWIATEDAGIAIFDKQNNSFNHLLFDEKNPNTIPSNNVHALLMDGNFCWGGFFMGGIAKIDIHTKSVKRYQNNSNNPTSISNNFVFALHNLTPDLILVGTQSGVDLFDKRTETFTRFHEYEFSDCHIIDIFNAPDNKVWFCTNNKGIFVLDPANKGLMQHFQLGDKSGLTSNSIISYCIDSKRQIWVGTRGNGLLKYIPSKQQFKTVNPTLLIDDVIYGIIEDDNRFLWLSTNKGISKINLNDSSVVHFNIKHGLAGNQHNYKSYFKDNNTLYFGGVTGFTWFNPSTISIPKEKPVVYFTSLRIFNEIILPKSKILKKQIDFTKHLYLKHNQNSFTLDFSSINYFTSDIVYQYYLEGFDKDWSPWTSRTEANYTNVGSGRYTFHIRAMNTINGLQSNERIVQITVKSPFWASWYAYLLYIILLWYVARYSFAYYQKRQKEKMDFTIEKIEKENLKLLHQHKMNFFTYISHEFKTPLSIIIASTEMLAKKENLTGNDLFESIKHSSSRLLALVNQLMEFRKIETEHAVIQRAKGNIIEFANQIINSYQPLLDKKAIELKFNVSYNDIEIFSDFDKLEKIITNLLTNAIKYSPQNGVIEFKLVVENNTIRISVKDNGNGISAKKREKIFEVFYSDEFANDIVESSGIGLALTASLVRLLSGTITVDSEPGKGSIFYVSIPYTTSSTNPLESPAHTIGHVNTPETSSTISETDDSSEDTNKEFSLVIVEDNRDLLMLLYKNFRKTYHVKCFENGRDAWEYINKKNPDILITDVMMPIMDGIELCNSIKTNVDLCHIPVIMLTAKDSREAKIEGLQVGADVYITKPFSVEELNLRVTNILNSQKALKNRLKELAGIEGFEIPVTNQGQAFIEKLLAVIQNNMHRSELDVQFIADELNISRTNLHNKMKTLMKMNTTEFVNTVRISKAKELILDENLTFSEISYKIGYNDSAYFNRIFKKHTGKTPGEYRQNPS